MESGRSSDRAQLMAEIGPARAGESLVLEVECRTSRKASRGKKHPVSVDPDWSVHTPHDLAAERIASAFGGYTSCLDLVDHALPAFREARQLVGRHRLGDLVPASPAAWVVGHEAGRCRCAGVVFPTATDAAEHVRGATHLAAKHGARQGQLESLMHASDESSGPCRSVPPEGWYAAGLVRESNGLDELWAAGVHPHSLTAIAALVPGCTEPLPVAFYLGVTFRRPDLEWLRRTLASCPDPDVAAWLTWTQEARSPSSGETVGRWLEMGVPRNAIETLLAAQVAPGVADVLVGVSERTARRAALDLAAWAQAGCRPTAEDMVLLDRVGIGSSYRPSRVAIDLVCEAAAPLEAPPSRTELAVMLALGGGRPVLHAMLRAGARTPVDAVAYLTDARVMEAG